MAGSCRFPFQGLAVRQEDIIGEADEQSSKSRSGRPKGAIEAPRVRGRGVNDGPLTVRARDVRHQVEPRAGQVRRELGHVGRAWNPREVERVRVYTRNADLHRPDGTHPYVPY